MSKSRRPSGQNQAAAQSNKFLVMTIAFAGLMIVAAAVVLLFLGGDDGTANDFVPEVTGAPRLALLSDTLIDHGDQQPNQYVDSVFRVKNVGDQPLTLACDDRVQLLEGC